MIQNRAGQSADSPSTTDPLPIAVLISGGGRTMANLAAWIDQDQLDASIVQVISSRPDVPGIDLADKLGLKMKVIARRDYADATAYGQAVWPIIKDSGAKLVCLAGFLSYIPIDPDYHHRVMNIHPALLPSFGGKGMFGSKVHEAVLNAGCKVSGCTVHFADEEYDHGPIIIQKTCAVHDDDRPEDLAERVFALECKAYPQAIQAFADNRLSIRGRRVTMQTPTG